MIRAGIIALIFLALASSARAEWRWVPWQIAPRAPDQAPIDRIRFRLSCNGPAVDFASFPGTWYGCDRGCFRAVARFWLPDGCRLELGTEVAGVIRWSPRSMPTEVYPTEAEVLARRPLDVDGNCRVDWIDEVLLRGGL